MVSREGFYGSAAGGAVEGKTRARHKPADHADSGYAQVSRRVSALLALLLPFGHDAGAKTEVTGVRRENGCALIQDLRVQSPRL
jgi:hypothetical protein